MTCIPIKKIKKRDALTGLPKELYAVPSVAISTPQGRKLIPNPAGGEASLFDSLEEAEDAIRRAGFDYEFEGKKTVTFSPSASSASSTGRASGHPLEQAVPLLIKQLSERDPAVVANASYALGTLRAHAALEPMLQILGHDDPHVRKNVADAIARLGPSCISSLQSAFQAAKASQAKNAPYIRLTILNAFLEMLEQGWGTAASEQFLPLVVSALEDESWLVRGQAALVVGKSAQILEDERRKAERHPRA